MMTPAAHSCSSVHSGNTPSNDTLPPNRPPARSSANSDTTASGDTVRALPTAADPSVTDTLKPIWTKDELKDVLKRQSGTPPEEEKTWKNSKNPKLAMLCALLMPGLGQIYNERPVKAVIAFGAETFYLSRVVLNKRYAERQRNLRDQYDPSDSTQVSTWHFHDSRAIGYDDRALDWIWWAAGAIAVIVLDAYVDAHLHDMRIEVEKRPEEGDVVVMFTIKF